MIFRVIIGGGIRNLNSSSSSSSKFDTMDMLHLIVTKEGWEIATLHILTLMDH
jgi:hypothetical protein